MKVLSKYFIIFMMSCIMSLNVNSQGLEAAGAKVKATIVESGSIAKTVNTDFGNVAVVVSAFIKMAPLSPKTVKGGIILPISSGTFTAAVYNFTGTEGFTYSVSYPTSPFIIKTGPDSMMVNSFEPESGNRPGSDLIAGVFVSITSANVTVNYN